MFNSLYSLMLHALIGNAFLLNKIVEVKVCDAREV